MSCRTILRAICLVVLMVSIVAPAAAAAPEFIVVFKGENADPVMARELITRAGGELVGDHLEIGVAVVRSDRPFFVDDLSAHPSVLGVDRNVKMQAVGSGLGLTSGTTLHQVIAPDHPVSQSLRMQAPGPVAREHLTVTDPTQARFWNLLGWAYRRIDANDAWALGHLGDPQVTVAVVDTGIDYTHVELQGKIDLARSVSFVPEDDAFIDANFPGEHHIADLNFHGTFNAGVIACNAINTACVSPNVTLVGVKVLNQFYETTPARMVAGILYAADIGADVISLATNLIIPFDTAEERASFHAINRAIKEAFRSGSIVLAEAGVQTSPPFVPIDADADGNDRIVPAQAGAVTVSATDINDDWSEFNHFGLSLVDVGAPGGSIIGVFQDPFNNLIWGPCSRFTQLPVIAACKPGGRTVSVLGSIGATSVAAGVAALIDSLEGGALKGRQIQEHLFETVDDIGDPGIDPLFGHGRVNALNAVTTPVDDD